MCVSFPQSIFMFPLSFSSSSSLSSIPPSLDSISEFEHTLSDISEDAAHTEDTAFPDTTWTLSLHPSPLSDQQLTDHLTLSTPSHSYQTTNTWSLENLEAGERCQVETRATAGYLSWQSWVCLKQRIKYFYYLMCFLIMMGKKGCITAKLIAALSRQIFTSNICKSAEMFKACAVSVPKLITSIMNVSTLHHVRNYMSLKWACLVAFLTRYLPTQFLNLASTLPWFQTRLHLPALTSSTLAPVVYSFPSSVSSVHVSSHLSSYFLLTRPSLSPTVLTTSLHQYLLNPSPLFLPSLLVVFLLVVMLTASQSLVLALILATPLGLTLFYLESVVSSQRRAVLPMLMTKNTTIECSESQLSSGFNVQASPAHTSPNLRHQTSTTWTQDMCDPAA